MEIIINEEMIKNDFIEYMETICMNNIDNASITRNINIRKNDLWKFIQFTKDKKWAEKLNYQNILVITNKNRSEKPWYRRSFGGDQRRNGISSIKSINTVQLS